MSSNSRQHKNPPQSYDHSRNAFRRRRTPVDSGRRQQQPQLALTPSSSWSSSGGIQQQQQHPYHTPLVLDAASSAASSVVSVVSNEDSYDTAPFLRRPPPQSAPPLPSRSLLSSSYDDTALHNQQQPSLDLHRTAAAWARQAPQAGFLQKQGQHVAKFKRRFFVLQPSTFLYYFMSPDDVEPRGCLDLDGSRVELLDHQEEEDRYRFALVWDGDSSDSSSNQQPRRVVLEARSKELAEEWMQRLKQERISVVQEQLERANRKNSASASRIAELEQQVAHFQHVEQDRDGALQDAARWKEQFERLDENLRRLTQRLRRAPHDDEEQDVKKESSPSQSETEDESEALAPSTDSASRRQGSLLDNAVADEGMIDVLQVPGIHFGALFNACEQVRENHRLASLEASTAVEDLNAANEQVVAVEKRMAKAEKQLVSLWEENCAVRKALKQKKREKRVLVREVKNLLEAQKLEENSVHPPTAHLDAAVADDSSSMACPTEEEEDRLINELEEHLASSIRLHEHMLNGGTADTIPAESTTSGLSNDAAPPSGLADRHAPQLAASRSTASTTENSRQPNSDLVALFDETDTEDEGDAEDDTEPAVHSRPSIRSKPTQENGIVDDGIVLESNHAPIRSPYSSPDRPNPLLQLDDESHDEPNLCAASSQSESSKSVPTAKGHATSKLVCPLVDVIDTGKKSGQSPATKHEESKIYHLSFYSRKIGIQFQKVPPPQTKAKGLLTDAMTADLETVKDGGDKTSAELRRIAAFSTHAKTSEEDKKEDELQVATPVDAVLVCGFHGFDDSGSIIRPKLGARLVGFDGVSVEIGKWTFDSIRKAIQARGRPLTLSFRNDFLTPEQRAILTRAVKETGAVVPQPPRMTIQYNRLTDRPPSIDPSLQSHETDRFINAQDARSARSNEDDLSVSVTGVDPRYDSFIPQSFSGARSVSSFTQGSNLRSFSEAGSSTSVLSAVAPLVSNLLGRSSEPFTPEYLKREPESVEDTPQHQDFQSELL